VGEEQNCFSYRVTRTDKYEKRVEMKDCKGRIAGLLVAIVDTHLVYLRNATCNLLPNPMFCISRAGAGFEVVHLAA
jgi:hypothetical protein